MAHILITDDSIVMRLKCRNILERLGHTVTEACNGLEAIEKYREVSPALVFMDITMPEMDGLTAVAEIVSIDPSAKIIMLTALNQQEAILNALRAGARDFVAKPLEDEKISRVVNKYLGSPQP